MTKQAKDIDLNKSQTLDEPLEGFEFRDFIDVDWEYSSDRLYAIDLRCTRPFKTLDVDNCAEQYRYCRPIQQPKTEPLTHFEILKMVDAVVYFRERENGLVYTVFYPHWKVEHFDHCLGLDFQKAPTLEDVVWEPLTKEVEW